jgi:hypothetical protein
MKLKYCCDYCGASFLAAKACQEHEDLHPNMDLLKITSMHYEKPMVTIEGQEFMPDIIGVESAGGFRACYEKVGCDEA